MKGNKHLTKRGKTIIPSNCKRPKLVFTSTSKPANPPFPVYLEDEAYYQEYKQVKPGVYRLCNVAWLEY